LTDETSRKVSSKDQNPKRTRTLVQSDPEIMAGAPVFRGTRVPVYLIADMIEQGTPIDEILDGYPSLAREMVGYAEIYATAHPPLGRSPVQPWSGTKPLVRKKGKLRPVT
jgi:uncharacterized protein (DUF433 family)